MWVAIFGNNALDLIRSGNEEFAEATIAKPEQSLYLMLDAAGGRPVIALALFVGILFYVTSVDSGALVMSNLCVRQRGEHQLNQDDRNNITSTLTLILHQRFTGGLPKNLTKALGIAPFIR